MYNAAKRDYPERINSVDVDLVLVGNTVILRLDCLTYEEAERMYDTVRRTLNRIDKE